MKLILLFAIFAVSCVHQPVPTVRVISVGQPVDTSKNLAIYDLQGDKESLIEFSKRKKIIDACKLTAEGRGLNIVPFEQIKENKVDYVMFFTIDVSSHDYQSYVPAYTTPIQTNCTRGYYGTLNCSSYGGNTYGGYSVTNTFYLKLLNIEIFNSADLKQDPEKAKAIRQIRAVVSSNDSSIKEATGNVLCRGALSQFPMDVEDNYSIPNPDSPYIQQENAK